LRLNGTRPALRIFSVRCARDKRRRSLRENARRLTARIIETNSHNESFDIGGAIALPGLISLM
jgi:hypothetical protein